VDFCQHAPYSVAMTEHTDLDEDLRPVGPWRMDPHWRVDSPSDAVVWQLKEIRKRRGWSAAKLAEECAKAGFPQLTESVIANIESGRPDEHGKRRRAMTVDELWAFARTLDVSLASLLWPLVNSDPEGDAALLRFPPRELVLFVHRMQAAAAELVGQLPPDHPETEAGRQQAAAERREHYEGRGE
jgi:transcriptional regulator with XRE-family HTH domain